MKAKYIGATISKRLEGTRITKVKVLLRGFERLR